MLVFSHKWSSERSDTGDKGKTIATSELLRVANITRDFILKSRKQLVTNDQLSLDEVQKTLVSPELIHTFEAFRSHRRRLAFWRVARTIADLDLSDKIQEKHLLKSQLLTVKSFAQMRSM